MVRRRVDWTAEAVHGQVVSGALATEWSGVLFDSRKVEGGELFFALPGETADGHRFVASALQAGAAAAVVQEPVSVPDEAAIVRVDDTYKALHALAQAVRRDVPKTLVGLTGSAGKTTTKELLTSILRRRFRAAGSPGNFNNLLGFPISLLGIADDTEVMVAEMGMSLPGELRQVSLLGRPDLVILLNVRPVHQENFADLAAIGDAKAEIFDGLASGGQIVANADDPQVVRVVDQHRRRLAEVDVPPPSVVWFASRDSALTPSSQDSWVWATDLEIQPGGLRSRFVLHSGDDHQPIELPLLGHHNFENALAAAACALALGASMEDIARALEEAKPAAHRGVVHRHPAGSTVVDDTYNSNPVALERVLEATARLDGRRHVAILGDMLELGPEAEAFHRRCGERAIELGYGLVVGVGSLARHLTVAASSMAREGVACHHFDTASSAADWLGSEIRAGDVVLVKGSRGVGLEVVVEALLNQEEVV